MEEGKEREHMVFLLGKAIFILMVVIYWLPYTLNNNNKKRLLFLLLNLNLQGLHVL